jgi:hypothetical protein
VRFYNIYDDQAKALKYERNLPKCAVKTYDSHADCERLETEHPVFTCTNVSATRIIITSLTLMQTILSINMLENIGKHDMRSEGKKNKFAEMRSKNI